MDSKTSKIIDKMAAVFTDNGITKSNYQNTDVTALLKKHLKSDFSKWVFERNENVVLFLIPD